MKEENAIRYRRETSTIRENFNPLKWKLILFLKMIECHEYLRVNLFETKINSFVTYIIKGNCYARILSAV